MQQVKLSGVFPICFLTDDEDLLDPKAEGFLGFLNYDPINSYNKRPCLDHGLANHLLQPAEDGF